VSSCFSMLMPLRSSCCVRESCLSSRILTLPDVGMPGMDGLETARRLRAGRQGEDVRIIALTAWGAEPTRRASAVYPGQKNTRGPVRDLPRAQRRFLSVCCDQRGGGNVAGFAIP
jgi:hypothetical protein